MFGLVRPSAELDCSEFPPSAALLAVTTSLQYTVFHECMFISGSWIDMLSLNILAVICEVLPNIATFPICTFYC